MIHLILQRIVWAILGTLIRTYKIEVIGKEHQDKARTMNKDKAFVFSIWHQTVISAMAGHAWGEPYQVLASRSKDGDYAAYIALKMGYVPVRGSSKKRNKDKGGKEAIQTFVEGLKKGVCAGITVDGPKGPAKVCKVGAIVIAQQANCAVLPTIALAKSYWEFSSWDKMRIAKPFTTIRIIYGAPFEVPTDSTPEQIDAIRLQVSAAMNKLEADFK